jgi:7-cyano-7-deazaguanine tRNA-ribosyltransferase
MERFDSSTKSAFFYGGIESNERTEVLRYRRKLEAMEIKKTPVLITTLNRELEDFEEIYYFKPPFGPFPKELEETYPFNCETPDIFDEEMVKTALKNVISLIENEKNRGKEILFEYDERYDHPLLEEVKRCTEVKKSRCDLKC